jgi:hypothetical protein
MTLLFVAFFAGLDGCLVQYSAVLLESATLPRHCLCNNGKRQLRIRHTSQIQCAIDETHKFNAPSMDSVVDVQSFFGIARIIKGETRNFRRRVSPEAILTNFALPRRRISDTRRHAVCSRSAAWHREGQRLVAPRVVHSSSSQIARTGQDRMIIKMHSDLQCMDTASKEVLKNP